MYEAGWGGGVGAPPLLPTLPPPPTPLLKLPATAPPPPSAAAAAAAVEEGGGARSGVANRCCCCSSTAAAASPPSAGPAAAAASLPPAPGCLAGAELTDSGVTASSLPAQHSGEGGGRQAVRLCQWLDRTLNLQKKRQVHGRQQVDTGCAREATLQPHAENSQKESRGCYWQTGSRQVGVQGRGSEFGCSDGGSGGAPGLRLRLADGLRKICASRLLISPSSLSTCSCPPALAAVGPAAEADGEALQAARSAGGGQGGAVTG